MQKVTADKVCILAGVSVLGKQPLGMGEIRDAIDKGPGSLSCPNTAASMSEDLCCPLAIGSIVHQ